MNKFAIAAVAAGVFVLGAACNSHPTSTAQESHPGTPTVTTSTTPAAAPVDPNTFTDGTYVVGSELAPGRYRTAGPTAGSMCYWERAKDLSGSVFSINANDNIKGQTTIAVSKADVAVEFSGGCVWRKVS